MAVFKCKMCGGDLIIAENQSVAECEYCGTRQTVSMSDDEKRVNLFNRANRLRIGGEFDKAAAIYESIVAEFPEEAEAYWGLVICDYGIEYVDDPTTARKIPTCHRASFDSILQDDNYKMALEYADVVAQKVYRDEAREIDRIREEILAISKNEKPYDVFICYKETDEHGDRTVDSVIAQDVYEALVQKGYKVFFARISLEDKLGRQYEPYIFAALNSAKVMLAFGTKYEYYHAVWVKNEWSRFLKLMAKNKSKVLIPCYKGIDAYDIPEEFKSFQAQDMGKIGALQDLVRGIGKIIESDPFAAEAPKAVPVSDYNVLIAPLIKRVFMFLGEGNWKLAEEYCEKVLDLDPECAEAYLGKLMVELHVSRREDLQKQSEPFDESGNFKKCFRFADEALKAELQNTLHVIDDAKRESRMAAQYSIAEEELKKAHEEHAFLRAEASFRALGEYRDAAEKAAHCAEKAVISRKDATLARAKDLLAQNDAMTIEAAKRLLRVIPGWKNADELLLECDRLKAAAEERAAAIKLEQERWEAEETARIEAQNKLRRKIVAFSVLGLMVIVVFGFFWSWVIGPAIQYGKAENCVKNGAYSEAVTIYEWLETKRYKDAASKLTAAKYNWGVQLLENKKYEDAYEQLKDVRGFDGDIKFKECALLYAQDLVNRDSYLEAEKTLNLIKGYQNSDELLEKCYTDGARYNYKIGQYSTAVFLYEKAASFNEKESFYRVSRYKLALEYYRAGQPSLALPRLNGLQDLVKKEDVNQAKYDYVTENFSADNSTTAQYLAELKKDNYRDSAEKGAQLFPWKIQLEACNTDANDYYTTLSEIPMSAEYLHLSFELSGGLPDEKITMYHKTQWPGESAYRSDWKWENRTRGSFGVEWSDGYTASYAGDLVFEIYNSENRVLLASFRIPVGNSDSTVITTV